MPLITEKNIGGGQSSDTAFAKLLSTLLAGQSTPSLSKLTAQEIQKLNAELPKLESSLLKLLDPATNGNKTGTIWGNMGEEFRKANPELSRVIDELLVARGWRSGFGTDGNATMTQTNKRSWEKFSDPKDRTDAIKYYTECALFLLDSKTQYLRGTQRGPNAGEIAGFKPSLTILRGLAEGVPLSKLIAPSTSNGNGRTTSAGGTTTTDGPGKVTTSPGTTTTTNSGPKTAVTPKLGELDLSKFTGTLSAFSFDAEGIDLKEMAALLNPNADTLKTILENPDFQKAHPNLTFTDDIKGTPLGNVLEAHKALYDTLIGYENAVNDKRLKDAHSAHPELKLAFETGLRNVLRERVGKFETYIVSLAQEVGVEAKPLPPYVASLGMPAFTKPESKNPGFNIGEEYEKPLYDLLVKHGLKYLSDEYASTLDKKPVDRNILQWADYARHAHELGYTFDLFGDPYRNGTVEKIDQALKSFDERLTKLEREKTNDKEYRQGVKESVLALIAELKSAAPGGVKDSKAAKTRTLKPDQLTEPAPYVAPTEEPRPGISFDDIKNIDFKKYESVMSAAFLDAADASPNQGLLSKFGDISELKLRTSKEYHDFMEKQKTLIASLESTNAAWNAEDTKQGVPPDSQVAMATRIGLFESLRRSFGEYEVSLVNLAHKFGIEANYPKYAERIGLVPFGASNPKPTEQRFEYETPVLDMIRAHGRTDLEKLYLDPSKGPTGSMALLRWADYSRTVHQLPTPKPEDLKDGKAVKNPFEGVPAKIDQAVKAWDEALKPIEEKRKEETAKLDSRKTDAQRNVTGLTEQRDKLKLFVTELSSQRDGIDSILKEKRAEHDESVKDLETAKRDIERDIDRYKKELRDAENKLRDAEKDSANVDKDRERLTKDLNRATEKADLAFARALYDQTVTGIGDKMSFESRRGMIGRMPILGLLIRPFMKRGYPAPEVLGIKSN